MTMSCPSSAIPDAAVKNYPPSYSDALRNEPDDELIVAEVEVVAGGQGGWNWAVDEPVQCPPLC
jgi:hypothetical protein